MNRNTIWIAGADGRIGSLLEQALHQDVGNKVIATDKDVDVTSYEDVKQACDMYRPNIIINCASISNAAYCEENEIEAYKVNTLGARNMAAAARQHNAKIIYLSTDDVFCGTHNRPKNEFDVPTPETIYGKSKLAGENFTRELTPRHLIIRSSWVYGFGKTKDFVAEVLEHAAKGESFEVPVDRVSSPTWANSLVNFIVTMIDRQEYGIYHAADQGVATRHQFASAILSNFGYDPTLAVATMSGQGGAIVSTALDNLMMKMTGAYEMPRWQDDLKAFAASRK